MKLFITILLAACTSAALAQQKTHQSLHQDINDDGKTLSINISGTSGGKTFGYSRQFNVTGMSKAAKEAIINHITDSLGIKRSNHTPAPPVTPAPVNSTSVTSSVHSVVREHGDTMLVQITGIRNNAPLNYNRTFKIKGLSKPQKEAIVKHITDSLGIGPVRSK